MLLGFFPSGGTTSGLNRAVSRAHKLDDLVGRYRGHIRQRVEQAIADRSAVITTMKNEIIDLQTLKESV